MARELVFKINDKEFSFAPTKIDRKKLYGWTEVVALDDNGNECKLVNMDESGTVIIPKGCIGLGMLKKDMNWADKSELIAVDGEEKLVEPLPSSFSVKTELNSTVTMEEFLDHSIVLAYELEDSGNFKDFTDEISQKIYTFTFNYREGYEGNPAFLMESEGKVFVLVGVHNDFSYVGLEDSGFLDDEEEDEESSEELGIDFSMM